MVEEDKAHEELLDKEAKIRERVDEHGKKWRKVYFGADYTKILTRKSVASHVA